MQHDDCFWHFTLKLEVRIFYISLGAGIASVGLQGAIQIPNRNS
ncbi:hypothetical protein KsCSTR_43680 [Candidatus Kuenenia stuttgartiensis]|jgi:hypothetical protein|uniref:Uncharacterized protein n=1 Tax=Kuenenia stuttgartiensis TaxID=174633 RepID=A0A6G7GX12_KUEST|nr:hypothetical protein [Enterococcus faecalis]QII13747.1 hypothetical protein KsCSTR_43680 [Candidatus Kuenenia stuttgartiensis]